MKSGTSSAAKGGRRERRRGAPRPRVVELNEPSVEATLRAQLCLLGYSTPEIERLMREREERLKNGAEAEGDKEG